MESLYAFEWLRWFGVVCLSVIVLFGALPQLSKPFDVSESASQSWQGGRYGHWPMGATLTVFGAGLCAFVAGWLVPTYHLAWILYPLAAAGYLGILAIAWVPIDVKPGDHSLHHPHFIGGAFGATSGVIGYICILAAGNAIPPAGRVVTIVALMYSALWPAFFTRKLLRYFLALEGMLVLLFLAVITILTIG